MHIKRLLKKNHQTPQAHCRPQHPLRPRFLRHHRRSATRELRFKVFFWRRKKGWGSNFWFVVSNYLFSLRYRFYLCTLLMVVRVFGESPLCAFWIEAGFCGHLGLKPFKRCCWSKANDVCLVDPCGSFQGYSQPLLSSSDPQKKVQLPKPANLPDRRVLFS